MPILAAIRYTPARWLHGCRPQVAPLIPYFLTTSRIGATRPCSRYQPKSRLSLAGSPSSATSLELMSSQGGPCDSVLPSFVHALGLRRFEPFLPFSDFVLNGEGLEGHRQSC